MKKNVSDINFKRWFNDHFFLSLQVADSPYSTTVTLENLAEMKELIDSDVLNNGVIYCSDYCSNEMVAIADNSHAFRLYEMLSDLNFKFEKGDLSFIDFESHKEYTKEDNFVDLELLYQDVSTMLLA